MFKSSVRPSQRPKSNQCAPSRFVRCFDSGSLPRSASLSFRCSAVAGTAALLSLSAPTRAAIFASAYVPSQTTGLVSGFDNPQAALGAPSPLTGAGTSFQGILSPFNPAYEPKDIVEIGSNGQLTLQFPNYIQVGGGSEVGIVSNNFFIDAPAGSGMNQTPVAIFGSGHTGGGTAEVRVSADGINWYSIGTQTFSRPANYFQDATDPYQSTPGMKPADFGIPFTTPLTDFNGLNGADTIKKFGASGGGTWLNLAASGLSQIDYIQFRVPNGGELVIDSVAANNTDIGAAVPEPGASTLVFAGAVTLLRRRSLAAR